MSKSINWPGVPGAWCDQKINQKTISKPEKIGVQYYIKYIRRVVLSSIYSLLFLVLRENTSLLHPLNGPCASGAQEVSWEMGSELEKLGWHRYPGIRMYGGAADILYNKMTSTSMSMPSPLSTSSSWGGSGSGYFVMREAPKIISHCFYDICDHYFRWKVHFFSP